MKLSKPKFTVVPIDSFNDYLVNLIDKYGEDLNENPTTDIYKYDREKMKNMQEYTPRAFQNPIITDRVNDLMFYLTIGVTYQSAKMLTDPFGIRNDISYFATVLSNYYKINVVDEIFKVHDKLYTLLYKGYSINELEEVVYHLSNNYIDARLKINAMLNANMPVDFCYNTK